MQELKTVAESLVSSTVCDFNGTGDLTLYTVPSGKSFVPTMLVVRALSADMASTTFTAGKSDAKTDFVGTITCSGANGVTKILVIRPNVSAAGTAQTPAAGNGLMTIMAAGETFVLHHGVAAGGACTGTVDLFGYLF